MSAVADPTEQQDPETPAHVPAEAEQSRQEIFKYAEYVHVGPDAAECDHATDGRCDNDDHYHLWCRLPNPFQVRDISEKARAAKARKIRQLRDPEADAHVILEQELDVLRSEGARPLLVDEIVERDFSVDYDTAVRAVMDLDDPDFVPKEDEEGEETPKLYANIHQDQEEYDRQSGLPEEKRGDDFPELEKALANYSRAVDAELEKIQAPRRENLMARPMEELVDIARQDRIDHAGNEEYLHTFNTWQWYVCTYKPRGKGQPNERVFSDVTQFKYEAPGEVIDAIAQAFRDLETRLAHSRAAKNS